MSVVIDNRIVLHYRLVKIYVACLQAEVHYLASEYCKVRRSSECFYIQKIVLLASFRFRRAADSKDMSGLDKLYVY